MGKWNITYEFWLRSITHLQSQIKLIVRIVIAFVPGFIDHFLVKKQYKKWKQYKKNEIQPSSGGKVWLIKKVIINYKIVIEVDNKDMITHRHKREKRNKEVCSKESRVNSDVQCLQAI